MGSPLKNKKSITVPPALGNVFRYIKRARSLSLSLVLPALLVAVLSMVYATANPGQASAATSWDSTLNAAAVDVTQEEDWSTSDTVMSAVYMRAFAACMTNSLKNDPVNSGVRDSSLVASGKYNVLVSEAGDTSNWQNILDARPANDNWNNEPRSALLDPNDDGKLNCNNEKGWIDNAKALWKIGSNIELLCTFGWYRTTATANANRGETTYTTDYKMAPGTYDDCVNGSGNMLTNGLDGTCNNPGCGGRIASAHSSTNLAGFKARMNIARGIDYNLDNAHKYLLYRYVFEQGESGNAGCRATQEIKYDDASADLKASVGPDKSRMVVKVVEGTGAEAVTADYIYTLADGRDEGSTVFIANRADGPIYNTSPAADGANTCAYIKDVMNDLIIDFLIGVQDGTFDPNEVGNTFCTSNPSAAGCEENGTTSCAVDGIGWLVCPVINFLAGVTDAVYTMVEGLLVTNVKVVDTSSGTYRAWEIMRNFGNIGFVLVFIIIIFSQITGLGISNYGIKRTLPRLIIVAILVNISFFVCQLAVDLSNIIGGSLKPLLDGLPIYASSGAEWLAQGNWFTNMAVGLLTGQLVGAAVVGAGALIYFGGIGLFIPIVIAALVAILMTLAILVARQALIVLLVALSPLAFLAILLPNTEQWFKRWQKVFVALLLIYPAIALLFGGARVASGVLVSSMGADVLGQLMGMAVMVLPLFLLPSILKNSLNAISAVGNIAQKLTNGAVAGSRKLTGKGMEMAGQRAAFGNSKGAKRLAGAIYGRGRGGRLRQTSARRAYEEPRIKDLQDRWANEGMMNNTEALYAEAERFGLDSVEGQAAIGRLAQMGDSESLVKLRAKAEASGKMAAYDKATAPHFAALKAKDMRTVFSGGALQGKYDQARATDMYGMSNEAIEHAAGASDAFRQTLQSALNDPDQARFFTPEVKAKFGAGGGTAAPAGGDEVVVPAQPGETASPGGLVIGGTVKGALDAVKELKIRR